MTADPVRVEREVSHSQADAYAALRDLARQGTWLLPPGFVGRSDTIVDIPPRKLVLRWHCKPADGVGASIVEMDVIPRDGGSLLRITHHLSEEDPTMLSVDSLYPRFVDETEHRCEWCGRAGEVRPMHVEADEGWEIGDPVLCEVCAGLLGFADPHAEGSIEERTRRQFDDSRRVVYMLLANRYEAEGRPRPAWMG